jgi:aspartate racemase
LHNAKKIVSIILFSKITLHFFPICAITHNLTIIDNKAMLKKLKFNKKIGIFGGAGPWASAHAVVGIIQRAQWDYHAVEDDEYPELILRSVPLKGFGAKGIEDSNLVRGQLFENFNRFAQDGTDVAVIACNSLHKFHPELQAAYPGIQIVNLPIEGAKAIAAQGYHKVGVLCSESALEDSLHKTALESVDTKPILPVPDQQRRINGLIRAVMAGNSGAREAQAFRKLSREFEDAGAQVLLSGCTELSYLSHKFQSNLPVVDCLQQSDPFERRMS